MEQEPWVGATVAQGHLHRLADKGRLHMIGHRPAHYSAAGQVDHGGQVGPALQTADIRDIAGPGRVDDDVLRPEGALKQVHRPGFGAGNSGATGTPTAPSRQAGRHHEPGHPFAAYVEALGGQLGMHPGCPVGALAS
jgi:hypothetical protein